MSSLVIKGNRPLVGEYVVPAAKNAVLPLLAATVLIEDEVCFEGCPHLSDIDAMLSILVSLGATASQQGNCIRVDCRGIDRWECASALSGCMRSSVFLLGSVLARMGRVSLGKVGGCVIGARPIDIHLSGLRAFGVRYEEDEARLLCVAEDRHAAHYRLPYPSVGATVNLLMFALSVEGESVLDNVAIEPEVVDLMDFLRAAGADVLLEGTTLCVRGRRPMSGLRYRPIGDRVVAATLLTACAAVGGEVRIRGVRIAHCRPLTDKIGKSSCIVAPDCDTIWLRSDGRPRAFDCTTGPYPAFATDMQALALAYNSVAAGVGVVCERVFESRFALVGELAKMGADIQVVGNTAIVHGGRLRAARTTCCDLRAGAALVVAALTAEGVSTIDNVGLIDRGYQSIEQMLGALGADIERIDERKR